VAVHVRAVLDVDERPDAPGPLPRLRHQRVEEPVGDAGVHVDALDGDADLAGVGERPERGLLGGPRRVDADVDDEGVVAAVLQHDVAPGARAGRAMARPVAVLPTCATTSTPDATSSAPTAPSPSTISRTPGGSCSATSSANRRPVRGSARSACGRRVAGDERGPDEARPRRPRGRSTA
jgi:hypothetical protein